MHVSIFIVPANHCSVQVLNMYMYLDMDMDVYVYMDSLVVCTKKHSRTIRNSLRMRFLFSSRGTV